MAEKRKSRPAGRFPVRAHMMNSVTVGRVAMTKEMVCGAE
jgi:hypothetical protein